MEMFKGTIVSMMARKRTDGTGEYHTLTVKHNDTGKEQAYLCFDPKIKESKVGDEISFSRVQKGDAWFLNLPKEKSGYYGGKGGGQEKDRYYTQVNALMQLHTMPLSYAKDLIVALAPNYAKAFEEPKVVAEHLLYFYKAMRNEMLSDPALMALLGAQAAQAQPGTEAKLSAVHNNFIKALREFFSELEKGDYLPVQNLSELICQRLSQVKDDEGRLVGGQKIIKDMSEAEAKLAFDRFMMFRSRECPKKPDECSYYKVKGSTCSWIARCAYEKEVDK